MSAGDVHFLIVEGVTVECSRKPSDIQSALRDVAPGRRYEWRAVSDSGLSRTVGGGRVLPHALAHKS